MTVDSSLSVLTWKCFLREDLGEDPAAWESLGVATFAIKSVLVMVISYKILALHRASHLLGC